VPVLVESQPTNNDPNTSVADNAIAKLGFALGALFLNLQVFPNIVTPFSRSARVYYRDITNATLTYLKCNAARSASRRKVLY
jgi:ABC-type transporter Mla maintaining outer membrane lipid asymmetry ATPase subunit MlaF